MASLGSYEWLIILALFALFVALFIAAMISIAGNTEANGTQKVLWVFLSLFFPLLGPILWFAIGKRSSSAMRG